MKYNKRNEITTIIIKNNNEVTMIVELTMIVEVTMILEVTMIIRTTQTI